MVCVMLCEEFFQAASIVVQHFFQMKNNSDGFINQTLIYFVPFFILAYLHAIFGISISLFMEFAVIICERCRITYFTACIAVA